MKTCSKFARRQANGERHLLATVRDFRCPQPRHGGESGGRSVRRDGLRKAVTLAVPIVAHDGKQGCCAMAGFTGYAIAQIVADIGLHI